MNETIRLVSSPTIMHQAAPMAFLAPPVTSRSVESMTSGQSMNVDGGLFQFHQLNQPQHQYHQTDVAGQAGQRDQAHQHHQQQHQHNQQQQQQQRQQQQQQQPILHQSEQQNNQGRNQQQHQQYEEQHLIHERQTESAERHQQMPLLSGYPTDNYAAAALYSSCTDKMSMLHHHPSNYQHYHMHYHSAMSQHQQPQVQETQLHRQEQHQHQHQFHSQWSQHSFQSNAIGQLQQANVESPPSSSVGAIEGAQASIFELSSPQFELAPVGGQSVTCKVEANAHEAAIVQQQPQDQQALVSSSANLSLSCFDNTDLQDNTRAPVGPTMSKSSSGSLLRRLISPPVSGSHCNKRPLRAGRRTLQHAQQAPDEELAAGSSDGSQAARSRQVRGASGANELNLIEEPGTYFDNEIMHTETHITVINLKSKHELTLTNEQLNDLSVRQLNRKLAGFRKEAVTKVKMRRRTLKNRGYASNCRAKRLHDRFLLELENSSLREGINALRALHNLPPLSDQSSQLSSEKTLNEEARHAKLQMLRQELNLAPLRKDQFDHSDQQTGGKAAKRSKSNRRAAQSGR